ncbi:MAG: hypothetical protein IH878_11345 [Gemmatimonadetes bacterium]|nr:hypothetical protein [Gemmatimonadota bacterium]
MGDDYDLISLQLPAWLVWRLDILNGHMKVAQTPLDLHNPPPIDLPGRGRLKTRNCWSDDEKWLGDIPYLLGKLHPLR